jgi:hypothetical protein
MVLQVEGGEEGEAGGTVPHVQRNPHVPRGAGAVRRQQPLLRRAVLQEGGGGRVRGGGANKSNSDTHSLGCKRHVTVLTRCFKRMFRCSEGEQAAWGAAGRGSICAAALLWPARLPCLLRPSRHQQPPRARPHGASPPPPGPPPLLPACPAGPAPTRWPAAWRAGPGQLPASRPRAAATQTRRAPRRAAAAAAGGAGRGGRAQRRRSPVGTCRRLQGWGRGTGVSSASARLWCAVIPLVMRRPEGHKGVGKKNS